MKQAHHLLLPQKLSAMNDGSHPLPDDEDLHRFPSPSEIIDEMGAIGKISVPTAVTGLVLYSRAMISMLFLGYLGELELAGGSLSIGFANITGYSVLSGLAMGMEPICSQSFGANQPKLLALALHRTVLLLLAASLPISLLWLNISRILLCLGQDSSISGVAAVFTTAAIPDLFFLSFLHPLRIYLRSQNITFPITACSAASVALHIPLNYLLVVRLRLGVAGVAIAMAWTNLNTVVSLLLFVLLAPGPHRAAWVSPTTEAFRGWPELLRLAVPTCASVCLEWWWYELMIILCGLLAAPRAAVASMGILIQTTSLVYVFPSSLSLAVSTRVGNELGASRPRRARVAAQVGVASAVVLGLAAMAFTTAIRHRWGRLFTRDPEILELTAAALPIAGLCELGNCPQTTGCGVLRGTARPAKGANINLGSFYLVGMPVAVFMGFVVKFGFAGLWFGLLAAQASCALLMGLALAKTDWAAEVERAKELTKSNTSLALCYPFAASSPAISDDGETRGVDDERGKDEQKKKKKKNGNSLEEIKIEIPAGIDACGGKSSERDPLIIRHGSSLLVEAN
ncbi:MATE efflux family protein 5 [Apostasia shenzhenica]|uniref:Protein DETOXIFICATION n=1 Tax=Apostasia shenzhenica TaxID=1088818 RepID=A0A2I0BFC9_9ASPA|nr:MATE efflux family protein 5 [Apostasia shenzhenica]